MKNVFKNVKLRQSSVQVFAIMLLKMGVIFGQETALAKRIVIDVGHGGKDSGVIGVNGIQEKDVVLDIALEILRLNEKSEVPLEMYLTRYSDTLISLSDRTKLAKILKADLYISLHCNHSDNPNVRGIEIYVGKNESEYSKESAWLAYQFQSEFHKKLGFESRGVKFANFQVLQETLEYFPAVLLELGFLSNADESKYYSNWQNIQIAALAIVTLIQTK